jgi:hypothetical protein
MLSFGEAMQTAIGFRPEFLDFQRGIRVGNLEERERITRILKIALESRYGEPFVTERWGRGVFWRWIGFLSRSNRAAKPASGNVSFGCAKFFLSMNPEEGLFQCGMGVERGYVKAPRESRQCQLAEDWDWHRLIRALRPKGPMERELARLLGEGFQIRGGNWDDEFARISEPGFAGVTRLRRALQAAPGNDWAGFQLFYPMREAEVRSSTGLDLVESMLAVFKEVTPVMNLCMQTKLREPQVAGGA